jgi:hypothetical protein
MTRLVSLIRPIATGQFRHILPSSGGGPERSRVQQDASISVGPGVRGNRVVEPIRIGNLDEIEATAREDA